MPKGTKNVLITTIIRTSGGARSNEAIGNDKKINSPYLKVKNWLKKMVQLPELPKQDQYGFVIMLIFYGIAVFILLFILNKLTGISWNSLKGIKVNSLVVLALLGVAWYSKNQGAKLEEGVLKQLKVNENISKQTEVKLRLENKKLKLEIAGLEASFDKKEKKKK